MKRLPALILVPALSLGASAARAEGARTPRALAVAQAAVPAAPEPEPAATAAEHRILLVLDRPNDAFAERIRGELVGLGFVVDVFESWRDAGPFPGLESAAREAHSEAAIRMLPTRKGVEIWMADRTSGRSLLRQTVVDESRGGPDENLVALQTAELMRTSLLARPPEPAPSPAPAPPPPDLPPPLTAVATAPPPAPEASAPFALRTGVGFLGEGGLTHLSLQGWLGVESALGASRFSVALDAALPLRDAKLEGLEGEANLQTWLVGLSLLRSFTSEGGLFRLSLGVGGAAVRFASTPDRVTAPLVAATAESKWVAAVTGRAEVALALSRHAAVGLRGDVGVGFPGVMVRFAGNDDARLGRPFLGTTVFVALVFP